MKPTDESDKTWKGIKAEVDAAVSSLRRDSAANRQRKIKSLADSLGGYYVPTRHAYRLARYDLAFHSDVVAAKASAAVGVSLGNCMGAADIEFMRVAYSAAVPNGVFGDWKDLGLRLLPRFPNDTPLKMAFVKDCWLGPKKTWVQIQKGIAVNEELALSNKWPDDVNIHGHRANLWIAAYRATNLKSHLLNGIKYTEINLKQLTDEKKRRIAQSWLDDLKKSLSEGKYKED